MSVRKKDNPQLYAKIEEHNLLRQYDLLLNCIEIGLAKGIEAFDKYTLWALNAAAAANISQFGGRFREEPIYVGNHLPPHFKDVPNEVDRFLSFIHENWTIVQDATTLPAYALWRLNWIHPFIEGNGRTARAACYYLLCMKQGRLLEGTKIVPERICANREPYYAALEAADRSWDQGHFDVTALSRSRRSPARSAFRATINKFVVERWRRAPLRRPELPVKFCYLVCGNGTVSK